MGILFVKAYYLGVDASEKQMVKITRELYSPSVALLDDVQRLKMLDRFHAQLQMRRKVSNVAFKKAMNVIFDLKTLDGLLEELERKKTSELILRGLMLVLCEVARGEKNAYELNQRDIKGLLDVVLELHQEDKILPGEVDLFRGILSKTLLSLNLSKIAKAVKRKNFVSLVDLTLKDLAGEKNEMLIKSLFEALESTLPITTPKALLTDALILPNFATQFLKFLEVPNQTVSNPAADTGIRVLFKFAATQKLKVVFFKSGAVMQISKYLQRNIASRLRVQIGLWCMKAYLPESHEAQKKFIGTIVSDEATRNKFLEIQHSCVTFKHSQKEVSKKPLQRITMPAKIIPLCNDL